VGTISEDKQLLRLTLFRTTKKPRVLEKNNTKSPKNPLNKKTLIVITLILKIENNLVLFCEKKALAFFAR